MNDHIRRRGASPTHEVLANSQTPNVAASTVSVPVTGSSPYLGDLLTGLDAQTTADFEEVWVLNGASDEVVKLLSARARSRQNVLVVRCEPDGTIATPRNIGVSLCRSEKVVQIDHDDVPVPQYVELMTEALDSHPFVSGYWETARLNGRPEVEETTDVDDRVTQWCGVRVVPAGTMGFTRDLYELVGGFDPNAGLAVENDFCIQAAQLGMSPWIVPDAVMHYRLRAGLWRVIKQRAGWGESEILVLRKHSALVPVPRHPVAGPLFSLMRTSASLLRRGRQAWKTPTQRYDWCAELGQHFGHVRGSYAIGSLRFGGAITLKIGPAGF